MPGEAAAGPCLDAEIVAAWTEGALSAKELAAAEAHASSCSRCLAILAAVERTVPEVPARVPSHSLPFRWLVPLAAAASAVAIWIAIPEQRVIPVQEEAVSISEPQTARERAPSAEPAVPPAAPSQTTDTFQDRTAGKQDADAQKKTADRADNVESPPAANRRSLDASADMAKAAPLGVPERQAVPAPPELQESVELRRETAATQMSARAFKAPTIVEAASPKDPRVRWRVVAGADVERSVDGGSTWTKTSSPSSAIVGVSVVDALHATVTTTDAGAFSTSDGGATWAPVQGNPAAPF